MRFALSILVLVAAAVPAMTGSPSDAVRFFYTLPPPYEPDIEHRARFTAPATTVFESNDAYAEAGGGTCIDFSMALDGQDYDEDVLTRTLSLEETVTGDTAEVVARFLLFESPKEIRWWLKKVGSDWLISDIEVSTKYWRLSELSCK